MSYLNIKYWLEDNRGKIIDKIVGSIMFLMMMAGIILCFYQVWNLGKEIVFWWMER